MTTTYPLEPDGYPDDGPIAFDRAIADLLRRTTTAPAEPAKKPQTRTTKTATTTTDEGNN